MTDIEIRNANARQYIRRTLRKRGAASRRVEVFIERIAVVLAGAALALLLLG